MEHLESLQKTPEFTSQPHFRESGWLCPKARGSFSALASVFPSFPPGTPWVGGGFSTTPVGWNQEAFEINCGVQPREAWNLWDRWVHKL